MKYYPAFLKLKGKRVILFGGGSVALRKLKSLVETEAQVTAISKEFSDEFLKFAKKNRTRIQPGNKLPKNWKTFSLVVAATSEAAFNHGVYQQCERANIFVNVVDDPKHSTFIVPSSFKRGALQIAVSTGGKSPLLAKLIRKKLSRQFGREYQGFLAELGRERKKVKRLIVEQKERRNHFEKLIRMRLKSFRQPAGKKS